MQALRLLTLGVHNAQVRKVSLRTTRMPSKAGRAQEESSRVLSLDSDPWGHAFSPFVHQGCGLRVGRMHPCPLPQGEFSGPLKCDLRLHCLAYIELR